jgi:uncharacterized Zn finger protein (UPF0148 family)
MSKFSAGKEVLSHCNKCKLTLAHTIVSMKDGKTIGKVECRTCKATHAYKDPSASVKKVKTKATSRTRSKSIPVNELWTTEMAKASGKARIYSIREKFVAGDILDHKKFGAGIVQNQIDGKIEVLFQHEIKTLVHNL